MKHFSITILLLTSCSTPDPVEEPNPIDLLPPVTMEQANTFGCLFNGEAWLPGSDLFLYNHTTVMYFPSIKHTSVSTERRYDDEDIWDILEFVIWLDDNLEMESVSFNGFSNLHGCWEWEKSYDWDSNSDSSFETLLLDFENQTLSATFNFSLISECDSTDRILIEEGRMDFTIL